jgi:site-specific recombinase XerD
LSEESAIEIVGCRGGQLTFPFRATRSSADGAPLTFGDAASRFLRHLEVVKNASSNTLRSYRSDYRQFDSYLRQRGLTLLTEVDWRVVEAFLAALAGMSPRTIRRKLNALSSLFKHFLRRGEIGTNPVDGVDKPRVPKRLPRPLPEGDLEMLLRAAMSDTDRAITYTLAMTGIRRGELLGLNCGDIDWDEGALRVKGKGDKERVVDMPDDLCEILLGYLGERRSTLDAPVIVNAEGRRMDPSTLQRRFRGVVRRAGLADRGYTPHSLRHTFATLLARQGVDIATIKDLMGHEDINTTAGYMSSSSRQKREAVQSLPFRIDRASGGGSGPSDPSRGMDVTPGDGSSSTAGGAGAHRDGGGSPLRIAAGQCRGELSDGSAEGADVVVEIERGCLQRVVAEQVLERSEVTPTP